MLGLKPLGRKKKEEGWKQDEEKNKRLKTLDRREKEEMLKTREKGNRRKGWRWL